MLPVKNLIPILVFLFPFAFAFEYIAFNISYKFSNYYFIPILFLLLVLAISNISKISKNINKLNLILFSILNSIILYNTNDVSYLKPIGFSIYFFLFYLYCLQKPQFPNWIINFGFLLSIFLSIFFLWTGNRYEGSRYMGFHASPTVFAIYAETILVYSLFSDYKLPHRIAIYLISAVFILLTKARLNILFLLLLPGFFALSISLKKRKLLIFILLLATINLIYPVYELIQKSNLTAKTMTLGRYEKGEDLSFEARKNLKDMVLDDFIRNRSWTQQLLGTGAEESRKLVIRNISYDILPHMDFLRLAYDFGILGLTIFLILLFRISIKSKISFILMILYLVSFYHNMVYDFYQISLILLFSARNCHKSSKKNAEESSEFRTNQG